MSHRYWRHWLSEPVAILRVAAPLAVAQLVMCFTGLIYSVMAGQFSVEALTAVAMGSAIWIPFNVFLVGLFSPLASLFSELVGRGRPDGLDATCRQGIGCALALWPVMQHSLGAKGFWYSLTLANVIASVLLMARYLKVRYVTEGHNNED